MPDPLVPLDREGRTQQNCHTGLTVGHDIKFSLGAVQVG